jgi:hypothetical protein
MACTDDIPTLERLAGAGTWWAASQHGCRPDRWASRLGPDNDRGLIPAVAERRLCSGRAAGFAGASSPLRSP